MHGLVATGVFGGPRPPKQISNPPQIEKKQHWKLVEFLSIFRVSSLPPQTQRPPVENPLATVLVVHREIFDQGRAEKFSA